MKQIRYKNRIEIIDKCYNCPFYKDGYPSCSGGCWMNVDDAIIPKSCPLEEYQEESKSEYTSVKKADLLKSGRKED